MSFSRTVFFLGALGVICILETVVAKGSNKKEGEIHMDGVNVTMFPFRVRENGSVETQVWKFVEGFHCTLFVKCEDFDLNCEEESFEISDLGSPYGERRMCGHVKFHNPIKSRVADMKVTYKHTSEEPRESEPFQCLAYCSWDDEDYELIPSKEEEDEEAY